MKRRDGKSQRRKSEEKVRGESQRREEGKTKINEEKSDTVRNKKMQAQEKVGKSGNQKPVFFQSFVAPEGRKVGSLKRRVRSQLVR